MLKAIFATIIIGMASGAGAVQLTIAEKLEDIVNSKERIRQAIESRGIQVQNDTPLSQYWAKIEQITCDTINRVPVGQISVSCGAYNIDAGTTTTCVETVGPNNATNKAVSWSSSNTSVATVNSGTGVVSGVAAGTVAITATAVDGSGVFGTSSNITVSPARFSGNSADFCTGTFSSSTALSIYGIFSSICSPPSATNNFPYKNCGGYTPTSTGTGTYDWTGTSCPLVSGAATIYGNARCSTQSDRNHSYTASFYDAYNSSNPGYCFRATNEPSNNPGVGINCWCQMCTDSSKTSCGGWVFLYNANTTAICASNCAKECGNDVNYTYAIYQPFRAALCAAPMP